jgi:phosphatidylglycerophosphate synthase
MKERDLPRFADFWRMRGTQAFWFTHYISYPSGALLAWLFARVGLTPTVVTLAGAALAWGTAAWVGFAVDHRGLGAVLLYAGLMLAYSLDCADGVLARATGQCSPFGAILDKVMDAGTMIFVPGLLGAAALTQPPVYLPARGYPIVMLVIIASRVLLAITIWLKDFTFKAADHLAEDRRERTIGWYVRRMIGQTTDTPVFYLLLGFTWWLGGMWEMLAIYGLWNGVIWLMYLAVSHRESRR